MWVAHRGGGVEPPNLPPIDPLLGVNRQTKDDVSNNKHQRVSV